MTEAPPQLIFRQVTPDKIIPLDCAPDGRCARASRVLAYMRERLAGTPDAPWAPLWLDDLAEPITAAVCDLWAAGLVLLWVAAEPVEGRRFGVAALA